MLIGAGLFMSPQKATAQALEQGSVTVDAYYGVASVIAKAFFTAPDSSTNLTSKFIGPIGFRFEYMGSDKVGVGLEYNYTIGESNYNITETDTVTLVTTTHKYTLRRDLHRFMPRINIHFGESETFDSYFGVAAGYRYAKWTYTKDGAKEVYNPGVFNKFALRLALGARYYFTDNIGVHMELGLGGGTLIHLGLSAKF